MVKEIIFCSVITLVIVTIAPSEFEWRSFWQAEEVPAVWNEFFCPLRRHRRLKVGKATKSSSAAAADAHVIFRWNTLDEEKWK